MKKAFKKIITTIVISAMLMSSTVFAVETPIEVEETTETNIILYAETDCVISENTINNGTIETVDDGSITELPSLTEKLDLRISAIETQQPSLFSNTLDYITEDVYSLSTVYYLSSIIAFNSMAACVNDLSVNVSTVNATEDDFGILYSQSGNINVSSSIMNYNGIIYAPNGNVTINSSSVNFNGVIIAKNIYINSSECTLSYDERVDEYIPEIVTADDNCYSKPFSEDEVITDERTGLMYVKNQIILTAQKGVTKQEIEALAESYNASVVGYLEVSRNYQIEFADDYTVEELDGITTEIMSNALVEDSSTNMVMLVDLASNGIPYTPNDPWLWDDHAWDESNPSGSNWGLEAINARGAWKYKNDMENVKVGIIDTKYLPHEDIDDVTVLMDKYWVDPGEDNNYRYHATNIAGIIGATHNNSLGISGTATNTTLYNTAHLYQKEGLFGKSQFTIGQELEMLITKQNVKVINASIVILNENMQFALNPKVGDVCYNKEHLTVKDHCANRCFLDEDGMPWSNEMEKLCYEYYETVTKRLLRYLNMGYDFLIVQAAGNASGEIKIEGSVNTYGWIDTKYTGHFGAIENEKLKDRIIVVGSISNEGKNKYSVSSFSSVGERVDIFAPGEGIITTRESNDYANVDGTSFAAPYVAGVASMVWGLDPSLTGAQVKKQIVNNYTKTVKIPKEHDYGTTNHIVNPQNVFGKEYPILDAEAAVKGVSDTSNKISESLPIGSFVNFKASPLCGLVSLTGFIDSQNTNSAFLSQNVLDAQLIWLTDGFLEYRIPPHLVANKELKSLNITMELCSEVGGYNNTYESLISFYINNKKIGEHLSPGDYGDKYGKMNPDWWKRLGNVTRYGDQIKISITNDGTYINGIKVSDANINACNISSGENIFRIEALNKNGGRGLNVFGSRFGNYENNIDISVKY